MVGWCIDDSCEEDLTMKRPMERQNYPQSDRARPVRMRFLFEGTVKQSLPMGSIVAVA